MLHSRGHSTGIATSTAVIARLDWATLYAAASQFSRNCSGILDHLVKPGDDNLRLQTFTSNAAKCPRRCSQVSRIRLGTATTTQITKNNGQPVAFATKPAPDDR